MAVRVALGETQLVQEVRRFLLDNGVSLDSFSQVGASCLAQPAAPGWSLTSSRVRMGWRVRPFADGCYYLFNCLLRK